MTGELVPLTSVIDLVVTQVALAGSARRVVRRSGRMPVRGRPRPRPHLQGLRRPWRRARRPRCRPGASDRRRVRADRRRRAADPARSRLPALLAGARRRARRGRHLAGRATWSTSGLASTDLLYFASGSLDLPGIMLTASHNPKQYNGLKFCQPGARPVGEDTGLREVRAIVEAGIEPAAGAPGRVEHRDLLEAYVEHVLRVRRRRGDAAAHGGGRHRQRDGWAGRARRAGAAAGHAALPLPRARRHLPEPPGRPARSREPARPEGRGARARRRRRASRSTATPTACSSSTSGPRT